MKNKVCHESSQSDDNNVVLKRASASTVPPFNVQAGECQKFLPHISFYKLKFVIT